MFTLRKLESLGKKTRLRKLVLLIQKAEITLSQENIFTDMNFFMEVFNSKIIFRELPYSLKNIFNKTKDLILSNKKPEILLRLLNNFRHAILNYLGSEPAEWDLTDFSKNNAKRKILPFEVYLEDIRSPFNVGSIFRTAEAFCVSTVYITENTPSPEHTKARKTSRGCTDIIPWKKADLNILKHKNVFALETGGTVINKFRFPDAGIVLIGSEELGISPEALKIADSSYGRVTIPMAGLKRSLNVSTAFGILMWSWYEQSGL